jgi:tRNA-specific 2-thiouridylase
VLCNTHIKWDALLRRADKLGCDFIATGHYANVRQVNGRFVISKGVDEAKDQSYALWGVSQASLARTVFPLGHLTKPQVRQMATDRGFLDLVNKSESYEICFIPDNDYRGFLKRRIPGLEAQVAGGEFIFEDGTVVGHHQGYPFYTVGQRKGLGIALGIPVFVVEIRKDTNQVVLGTDQALLRDALWAGQLNMIKYPDLIDRPTEGIVRIRYNDKTGTPAIMAQESGRMKVLFHQPVFAIAPGQAAVFYEGDDVIGGGWIQSSFRQDKANHPTEELMAQA